MRATKRLAPMPPETAWKFSERLDYVFQITDVWENADNIVEWLQVRSTSNITTVLLAVQMCYAGLARPDAIIEIGKEPSDWHVYNVHLDYGAD